MNKSHGEKNQLFTAMLAFNYFLHLSCLCEQALYASFHRQQCQCSLFFNTYLAAEVGWRK